jgi:hypothetical protein
MKRDTRAEYLKQRIPGAVFFDIDEVSDKSVALPHMLPPKDLFESAVSNLGISNSGTFSFCQLSVLGVTLFVQTQLLSTTALAFSRRLVYGGHSEYETHFLVYSSLFLYFIFSFRSLDTITSVFSTVVFHSGSRQSCPQSRASQRSHR